MTQGKRERERNIPGNAIIQRVISTKIKMNINENANEYGDIFPF